MRHSLPAAAAALASLALARPAAALPEIYAGLGAASSGVPSSPTKSFGFGLEAGVDDIFSDIGVGAQLSLFGIGSGGKPDISAELRYSILKIPFIRLLAGVGVGLKGFTASPSGSLGAFIAARVSLGMPYVGAKLGVGYAGGATAVNGLGTIGLAF